MRVWIGPNTRRLLPLGAVFLIVGLSTATVGPFLSLFLSTAVHAGPVRIGAFLVIGPLSAVVVSTLVGRLSDRRPIRRTLVVVAALAGAGGFAVTSVVRDYWILLALAMTATAVAGAVTPQLFAYAREILRDSGSSRAALSINALRMAFSIAWVAGPPVAAVLLSVGGFRLLYSTAAAMLLLAALTAIRWLPPSAAPVAADRMPPAGVTARIGRLRVAVTAAAFVATSCAGVLGVQGMSLYVSHDLHGTVRDAGLILGLCAGIEIPLMLAFGMLSTRYPLRRLVLTGAALGIVYYGVAATATQTWQLAVGQLLNACFIAAVSGLGISYVQELLPHRPGGATTLFTNTFPAGSMLAGPLLGFSLHFGYRLAYVAAGVLCTLGFTLLLATGHRRFHPISRAETLTPRFADEPVQDPAIR